MGSWLKMEGTMAEENHRRCSRRLEMNSAVERGLCFSLLLLVDTPHPASKALLWPGHVEHSFNPHRPELDIAD